jgi:hypothetical protein
MKFELPPVEAHVGDLMSYDEVREIFRWKDNRTVRDYCKQGLLKRVRTSKSSKGWRITAESVKALREHIMACTSDADYLEKARMQSMRERKGQDQPKQEEVLLDMQKIIDDYNSGPKAPLPPPQPENSNFTDGAISTRRTLLTNTQRLGFTRLRGI